MALIIYSLIDSINLLINPLETQNKTQIFYQLLQTKFIKVVKHFLNHLYQNPLTYL